MILQKEILDLSAQYGVPPDTIDKNWVLGHFLATLYKKDWARENMIFKGGTCLKKCYFADYRFSKDLDFTLSDSGFIVTDKLIQDVCNDINGNVGILFSKVKIDPIFGNDKQVGFSSYIRFWGANHKRSQIPPPPNRWQTSIKIEIITYEKILSEPLMRPLLSFYSDNSSFERVTIPCYSISEIIAEKLRAILQRSYIVPRDYYDLWYLTNESDVAWELISDIFLKKCDYKHIQITSINDFFENSLLMIAEKAWNTSLAGHLNKTDLPEFSETINELRKRLINLKI